MKLLGIICYIAVSFFSTVILCNCKCCHDVSFHIGISALFRGRQWCWAGWWYCGKPTTHSDNRSCPRGQHGWQQRYWWASGLQFLL